MERQPSQWQLEFPFDGGRLCLDLVGTVGRRHEGGGYERLRTAADLAHWIVEAGLAERELRVDDAGLRLAHGLREAIYRSVTAAMVEQQPGHADVELINQVAAWPIRAPRLDPTSGRLYWVSRRPLRAAMATVARDALEMLGSDAIDRVKECAAPDCSLLYLDASRAQRRRWCSMKRCGNQHKTASYRQRQKVRRSR